MCDHSCLEYLSWLGGFAGGSATCFYAFVFQRSLNDVKRQLRITGFSTMLETLQSKDVREARHRLFKLEEGRGWDPKTHVWLERQKADATLVCQAFDTIAYLARMDRTGRDASSELEKQLWDLWSHAIVRTWRIVEYLVDAQLRTPDGYSKLYRPLECLVRRRAEK